MAGTVPPGCADLVEAVQTNCHIADARHAADMTLCTYLLQMREFHRWERGLGFGAALDRGAVGAWLAEREALWTTLEEQAFRPLPLPDGLSLDPFDVAAVNARLAPAGLHYGAGLVGAQRPVFFLAERHAVLWRDGLEVQVAGRELARGLVAPPAALDNAAGRAAIVLRRESLARWCWEKFEAFTLRRSPGSPFHAVVQAYALDDGFDAALPRWLDDFSEAVILHELGEHRAGQRLGTRWADMRLSLPGRRADLHARALRDHLADLGVTLPTLLDRGASPSIHVWFAGFDGVRESLFPDLKHAYHAWQQGDGGVALRHAAVAGEAHFWSLAQQVLDLHDRGCERAGAAIDALLTSPQAVCRG
ncbi:Sfum_1244 family protein [Ideonella sp. A 288]|uniref:Sfum_1244 family protein n=1 Tax=Ideonella sp. A 288 TaxID=1962181 RepID=UPI001184F3B4|nr:Sfum_1244 family protein [Ideonella sp. A 288]